MPPSKTHSFRALTLAAIADGISIIRIPKLSPDWDAGVKAMKMFGAKIKEIEKNIFQINGVAGKLQTPEDVINVDNSRNNARLYCRSGSCLLWLDSLNRR